MQEFQSVNPSQQPQGAPQVGGTQSAEPKNKIDKLIDVFQETTGQKVPEKERPNLLALFAEWQEGYDKERDMKNIGIAGDEMADQLEEAQTAVKGLADLGAGSGSDPIDTIEIGGENVGLDDLRTLAYDPEKLQKMYAKAQEDGVTDFGVENIKNKVLGFTDEKQEEVQTAIKGIEDAKKADESAKAAEKQANNPQSAAQAKGFAVGKNFGTTGLYSGSYTDREAEAATKNNINYAQTTAKGLEAQRLQSEEQLTGLTEQLNFGVDPIKSGKIVGSEGPSAFDTKTKRPLAAAAAGTDKMSTAFNISPSEKGVQSDNSSEAEGKTLTYTANQDGLGVLKEHQANIDGQIAGSGGGLEAIQGAQDKLTTEATELTADKETQGKRAETVQKESASVKAAGAMWDQGIAAQQAQLDAAKAGKAGIAQTNKSDANSETLTRIADLGAATAQLAAAWAMPAADPGSAAAKAAAIAIAAANVAKCTQAKNKAEGWEGQKDQELQQAQQRIDEATQQLDQLKQDKPKMLALQAELDKMTAGVLNDLNQVMANTDKNSEQQVALGSASIAYTAGLQTDSDNLASLIGQLENSKQSSSSNKSSSNVAGTQETKGAQPSQVAEESSGTGEEDGKEKTITFAAYNTNPIENPASDESQNDPFGGINGLGKTQKKLMGSLMTNPPDGSKPGSQFNTIV